LYEKTTRDVLDFVLGGYNATVFAYGPTGTGKTHTMVGLPNNPGIMVRALNELFQMMNEAAEEDQFDVSHITIALSIEKMKEWPIKLSSL
jgi:kinesin family protein 18/19